MSDVSDSGKRKIDQLVLGYINKYEARIGKLEARHEEQAEKLDEIAVTMHQHASVLEHLPEFQRRVVEHMRLDEQVPAQLEAMQVTIQQIHCKQNDLLEHLGDVPEILGEIRAAQSLLRRLGGFLKRNTPWLIGGFVAALAWLDKQAGWQWVTKLIARLKGL